MATSFPGTFRAEQAPSADRTAIQIRSWRPAGQARAVIAVIHGFNSHGGYYTAFGEHFATAGFAVYALDLRGRGQSGGERYFASDVNEYTSDVDLLIRTAKSREPGLPVFLLGHSAGGVISSVYTLDHQSELAGLICESYALRVYAPDFVLSLVKGLSGFLPRLKVLTLPNKDFSRDPKAVAVMDQDPFVAAEAQPAITVAAMVRAGERLQAGFGRIKLPVLILHGSADKVTRPEGSRLFHENAGSADKTLLIYDGHAHDLLNDLGREKVISDIQNWIEARLQR